MKRTVVYSGSFNPVHNGHVSIAEYLIANRLADEVWLVVSPRNPFKAAAGLAPEQDRLAMAGLAARSSRYPDRIRSCDIELGLPRPSYTIDTLHALSARHPGREFVLLIGADNLGRLDRWKSSDVLLRDYPVWVYPREGYTPTAIPEQVQLLADAPLLDFAATDIRRMLSRGASPESHLPAAVWAYIQTHCLYGIRR